MRKISIAFVLLSVILLQTFAGCTAPKAVGEFQKASVMDFGARGDGVTDDTEAIQQAVNSGLGQIIFPTGTYRCTETIEVELDQTGPVSLSGFGTATVLMEGPGPAFKFIGTHRGTANPSSVHQNVWQSQRMPIVDGLEIVGKHPEAVGIEATGTMQLTITRLLVRKALHGIHLTTRNRNVIISECQIYENTGVGIYLDDVNLHQINITNSHVSYNEGGGIVVRNGEVRNLHIGTCDIESNMSQDVPATANIFIDMPEGSMREGAVTGCTIQHDHNAPGSANIRFIGHSTEDRRKAGNFTIADNAMSDVQDNIHIRYGRGIIISGNTLWKGYSHNILIEESSDILLGPNLLDRNPDYSYGDGAESKNAVVFRESYDLTINGLQLRNTRDVPAGIVMDRCRNYNLTNSMVLNCAGSGILLTGSENGKVSDNFINDTRDEMAQPVAIRIKGGRGNLITTNYVNGSIESEPNTGTVTNNHSILEER